MKVLATKVVYSDKVKRGTILRWAKILESGMVILGVNTKEFEARMASYLGRKHAVSVSNDTAALELAMRLIDVRGKEVIIPANGFYSVVTAIDRAGGIPLLVDIDIENNINFTASQIEHVINNRYHIVKAVVLMPCGGVTAADSLEIREVCMRNGENQKIR
jgi:perosamine synthetase